MAFKLWSRQAQPKRIINVGLDFGTSSSKMVWRDVTGDRLTLIGFDNSDTGYPAVCTPSSVKIADDRVWFGPEAETDRRPGWLVRSLKVCVACRAGSVKCRGCQPAGLEKQPGEFCINGVTRGQALAADDLAALLVGYMMKTARERIESSFRAAKGATFTWNMSAPLDQYEFSKLRASFERLAHLGSEIAPDVESGMKLRDALELVRQAAQTSMPSSEELTVSIVPEAIAAVHAYCQSPIAEHGLYALIDVGAGTTTVSFFRYHQASNKTITCYSSCTDAVGADDFDRAMSTALERRYPALAAADAAARTAVLHEIRSAKESRVSGLRLESGYELHQTDVDEALRPLMAKIYAVYLSAYRKAYKKEAWSDRWAALTVIFVGGGSHMPGVREELAKPPHPMVVRQTLKVLDLPDGLHLDGFGNHKISDRETSLLTVAFGLSYPRVDIPDYWETKEVEPLRRPHVRSREPEDWR